MGYSGVCSRIRNTVSDREKSYPIPDATVEGGMVAKMSPLFPNEPINLDDHVKTLEADGTVPYLPEFRWIHTPGHSEGHVSLFRDNDKALINYSLLYW